MNYGSYEMVTENSSDLPTFRGQARLRGRGFGAFAQTLGRSGIPFIKNYIVPAAKKMWADLFEIAALEIGEWKSCQWTKKTNSWEV